MENVVPTRVNFVDASGTGVTLDVKAVAAEDVEMERGSDDDEEDDGPAIGMTMLDGPSPSVPSDPVPDPIPVPQTSFDHFADTVETAAHGPKVSQKRKKKTASATAELIPPSRRTNLPFNIFVTSIDVEADLWGQSSSSGAEKIADEEPLNFTMLENGASAGVGATTSTVKGEGDSAIGWDGLDESWESLPMIDTDRLAVGSLLAWQVRSPRAFLLLNIAKISDFGHRTLCLKLT